jgi:hypothetical protein
MSFSFGFSGDDIEADGDDKNMVTAQNDAVTQSNMPPQLKAQSHRVEELVCWIFASLAILYISRRIFFKSSIVSYLSTRFTSILFFQFVLGQLWSKRSICNL